MSWHMPDWMREILSEPTTSVPDAARVLGISRNSGYEAAIRGELKTLRFGRTLRVPTTWLLSQLELPDQKDGKGRAA